jgi:hypothetical protein
LESAVTSVSIETPEHDASLAIEMWKVKQFFFAPSAGEVEFGECINRLKALTENDDDWTRLLGISGLLLLGEGTPELCQERNNLLDKGVRHPSEFTFPEEVREAANTEEVRGHMPQLFLNIFLHDPDRLWLLPELFDLNHPYSRFFLSKPREFYALATEVLDPKGETELAKWRRTT